MQNDLFLLKQSKEHAGGGRKLEILQLYFHEEGRRVANCEKALEEKEKVVARVVGSHHLAKLVSVPTLIALRIGISSAQGATYGEAGGVIFLSMGEIEMQLIILW